MNLIVAIDRKGAIGRRGELLYHISADLRRFKALTTGHTVVMGRKTFESLPKGALPKPPQHCSESADRLLGSRHRSGPLS